MLFLDSFIMPYENLTISAVFVGIITYLLKEKTDTKKEIAEMRKEIADIQRDRLEENKAMIELSLELLTKMKEYGPGDKG